MVFLCLVSRARGCRSAAAGGGRAHRGGEDDLVDDPGDECLVGQLAQDVDAVEDDAGQGRGEQVEVDVAGISPRSRARSKIDAGQRGLGADDVACGTPSANSRSREIAVITLAKVATVRSSVRPPWPQNASSRSPRSVAGVRGLRGALGREQGVDDEADLAVPAAVERRLGGLGPGRHGVHREPVVADVAEHLEGGVEDLLLAVTLDPRSGDRGLGTGVMRAPSAVTR